jgi:PhnB protein
MKLSPYLTFDGTALEAMGFYADALGGKVTSTMRFGDMPKADHWPGMPGDQMAHVRVDFGDQSLMASDGGGRPHHGFHGHSLQTSWGTPEEAKAAFDKLSEGGEVIMPCERTFWASAFGMCTDRYGVTWMVNCD